MREFLLLSLILPLIMGIVMYKISFALINSTASNNGNSFTAASQFVATPSATPTPILGLANHVVINEVSANGDNSSDWVELFNPTNSSIDISGWKIHDNAGVDTIPQNSMIPANSFGVIVASGSSIIVPNTVVKITLSTTSIGGGLALAGDRVILKLSNDTTEVDKMSYGTDTSIFTLPAITATKDLARNPNGIDTDNASDWILQTPTLGVINN